MRSADLRLNLTSSTYTVLSAGFSIFVHWKVAVNRVHNLRPCTGFLFPVYSRTYYGLYTTFFYLQMYRTFPVATLCAVILQRICRNSDTLSVWCMGYYKYHIFRNIVYKPRRPSCKVVTISYSRPEFDFSTLHFSYFSVYRIFIQ